MSHVRELISLATAALVAAEADAAQTGQFIFRDEWRPTPRTTQPQSTPSNAGAHWLLPLLNRMALSEPQLQQERPSPPSRPTTTSTSASAPRPLSSAAAVPASSPPPKYPTQSQLQEDAVGKLLKDNDDVFDRLINHSFPEALGAGTASLDGFRYYMIQDKMYLETCARLKMAAVARAPNLKDVVDFAPRHEKSLKYVKELKDILISMLGVPESIIDTTPRSKNLDASEKYYLSSVRDEDALFAYYVVLLPCVLSYWRIAERLTDNPSTPQNVVYYPAWIKPNYDPSSAAKYTDFINENIMAKGGVDRWNSTFRIACILEADLFNTGLQAPTPYQIVPSGIYAIQSSSAAEKVVSSLPGSPVVGVNKTGGNNEKWRVAVAKDGYTFQNVGTGQYLGIPTQSGRKDGRILQTVPKPYYWWINPVRSEPSKGPLLYQIYESGNLRYTLHADIDGLKSVNHVGSSNFDRTPIIARDNLEKSCQMWSFELEQLDRPDVLNPTIPGEEPKQDPVEEAPKGIDNPKDNYIDAPDEHGWTGLMHASSRGNYALVELLLSLTNTTVNKQDEHGWAALTLASYYGHDSVVKLLLSRTDINVNTKNERGWTALTLASYYGRVLVVKHLLSRTDTVVNTQTEHGRTALWLASQYGHDAVVKLLLSRTDTTVNTQSEQGWTALMLASYYGHDSVVKLLLSRTDINVNTQNEYGWTALTLASYYGRDSVIEHLLSRTDTAVNTQTEHGRTALMQASQYGHDAVVKLLLSRTDTTINTQGEQGWTALMLASQYGHDVIIELLLSRTDININTQNEQGWTALMLAAHYGHDSVVKLLSAGQHR